MNIFRKTDGYTEVTIVPEGRLCEIYVTAPGDTGAVLHAHFSDKLAWRAGLWLLAYWIVGRWCGLKRLYERKRMSKRLYGESLRETDQ